MSKPKSNIDFDKFLQEVESIELKPEKVIECPHCGRETKRVLEYTSEEKDHSRHKDENGLTSYDPVDVVVEHYTCLECNKGFQVKKRPE